MRTFKIAALASVAVAALTGTTLAADPIAIVDTPVVDDVSFGWDGPYAGVYVLGQTTPGAFGVGVNLGVNMTADVLVFGIEGDAAWVSAGGPWKAQAVGKVGAVLSDQAIIYALGGIGTDATTGPYAPIGVGAEFMVADNISVKAQYEFQWDFDNAAQNNNVGKVGLNFHF